MLLGRLDGAGGFADVWWRGKFGWEYKRKGKYKDLDEAYRQLCQYREALENPPLLIVSDIARTEIVEGLIPRVRPTQLHGIEINPFAAEVAQVVIWIGHLQWMKENGFAPPRDPILEPMRTIECRDAILDLDGGAEELAGTEARSTGTEARSC